MLMENTTYFNFIIWQNIEPCICDYLWSFYADFNNMIKVFG